MPTEKFKSPGFLEDIWRTKILYGQNRIVLTMFQVLPWFLINSYRINCFSFHSQHTYANYIKQKNKEKWQKQEKNR